MRYKLLPLTFVAMLMLLFSINVASANGPTWTLPYSGSTSYNGNAFMVINSGTGSAMYGVAQTTDGVSGYTYSSTAAGVRGFAGSGDGVKGETNGGGSVAGVRGRSNGAAGNGVIGEANNGSSAYGVWGISSTGWAGYFNGKVHVVGNLAVTGSKNFMIDHPLDPANKYLYHAAVESPDMMNIYNGNVTTDANGEAIVTLPDYFEALNRDFRYQLTVVGQFAQVIVAKEIEGNHFTIKTDKPNVQVSWQVAPIQCRSKLINRKLSEEPT
jgi:hypothetical protein